MSGEGWGLSDLGLKVCSSLAGVKYWDFSPLVDSWYFHLHLHYFRSRANVGIGGLGLRVGGVSVATTLNLQPPVVEFELLPYDSLGLVESSRWIRAFGVEDLSLHALSGGPCIDRFSG